MLITRWWNGRIQHVRHMQHYGEHQPAFVQTMPAPVADDAWIDTALAVSQNNGASMAMNGSEQMFMNGAQIGKLTMMEYAMLYFRNAPVKFEVTRNTDGTLKSTVKTTERKKKEWTWRDIAEQVKYQKEPLQHSLLRLDTVELDKLAVDMFNVILRYTGDAPAKKSHSITAQINEILSTVGRCTPLADELYVQLIKQTTSNKSDRVDACMKVWRLLSIVTAYVDCSDTLRPYLMKYLMESSSDARRPYHATATVCAANLNTTQKYGGRKYLMGSKEIDAITLGKHLKRQLYHMPGGHKKVINTRSTTVTEEVIQDLCDEMNVRAPFEQQEFCLCVILESENAMKLISNDEYVLDVCTELDEKNRQFFLLLKRTAWIHPLRLDNNLYIDVMFFQVVPDYLEGLLIVMRTEDSVSAAVMDDIARLAALLHNSDEDNANDRPVDVTARQVIELLPRTVDCLRHISAEQWTARVNAKLAELGARMPCRQARAAFLQLLQQWPLFGSTFFYINNVNNPRVQQECLLAINRHGVQFLHIVTHQTLLDFRLSEVLSTHKVTAAHMGRPVQFLDIHVCNALQQQQTITLQTDQGTEISRLLGQYIYVDGQNRGVITDGKNGNK